MIFKTIWQMIWSLLARWWSLIAILICLRILSYVLIFTNVSEGVAKAIMTRDGFKKFVMAWQEHELDTDWNVEEVRGKEEHFWGGLRFVGLRGMHSIYEYNFRWRGLELVGGKERVEFHEEKIDYILVKPDVYWTEIVGVETAFPERIPVDLEWLVTVKSVNPYKTLFRAPQNWNENMMARLNALFSGRVSAVKTLDDLLAWREETKNIWDELGDDPLLKMFKDDWGLEIIENGIELRAVTLPTEYQAAAARKKQMELEAEGTVAETVGTIIRMMAESRGLTPKEVQEKINKSTRMQREFLNLSKDLIIREMGSKRGAYADIRVQGAEGLERTILNALAVWQKMPRGKNKPSGNKKVKITKKDVEKERERLAEIIRET